MYIIACAISSLIAANFNDKGLCQVINAQLNTLAVTPQAKQVIIPVIFGMAKLTEV
jgi:hypothetical protein